MCETRRKRGDLGNGGKRFWRYAKTATGEREVWLTPAKWEQYASTRKAWDKNNPGSVQSSRLFYDVVNRRPARKLKTEAQKRRTRAQWRKQSRAHLAAYMRAWRARQRYR